MVVGWWWGNGGVVVGCGTLVGCRGGGVLVGGGVVVWWGGVMVGWWLVLVGLWGGWSCSAWWWGGKVGCASAATIVLMCHRKWPAVHYIMDHIGIYH